MRYKLSFFSCLDFSIVEMLDKRLILKILPEKSHIESVLKMTSRKWNYVFQTMFYLLACSLICLCLFACSLVLLFACSLILLFACLFSYAYLFVYYLLICLLLTYLLICLFVLLCLFREFLYT